MMSWNRFHHRGEILRVVVDTADERRDGVLPTDVPGVAAAFADELDLIGALQLKWHARLSGNIERAYVGEPIDLESAVVRAWAETAQQMRGVRLVLDRCAEQPSAAEIDRAMKRTTCLEQGRLAVAAGLASGHGAAAVAAGRRLEERARQDLVQAGEPAVPAAEAVPATEVRTVSLADRIRAALAA